MIARVSTARPLDDSDSPNQLTIEQLAAKSGMTVRNIRAHQARGLLAPPEVRMRVGYYGPEHVEKLQLIREHQEDGFSLAGSAGKAPSTSRRSSSCCPIPNGPTSGSLGSGLR